MMGCRNDVGGACAWTVDLALIVDPSSGSLLRVESGSELSSCIIIVGYDDISDLSWN
jgi:hypothetical protein